MRAGAGLNAGRRVAEIDRGGGRVSGFRARAAAGRVRARRSASSRSRSKALEEEVVVLRRRLQDAPKRVRTLEERLLETKGQLAQAVSQNEKLSATLREAREHIAALREEVEKLTMPPSAYGTFLGTNDDGTVDVFTAGRKMRVAVHPELDDRRAASAARRSCSTSRSTSCSPAAPRSRARSSTFKELLEDGTRALIVGRADEERVVRARRRADRREAARRRPPPHGRAARACCSSSCPRPEVEELVLEEVPDISYDDVGGLDDQIEHDQGRGRAAVPLRATCSTSTSCSRRRASCCTARPAAARRSSPRRSPTRSRSGSPRRPATRRPARYFLNIKGPELLNKYVGETERQIRLIFQRAREKSRGGLPGHRVLRRDGLAVPHPRHRHLAPTSSRRSCRSCSPRSTASRR